MERTPIAEICDGEIATVRGRIRYVDDDSAVLSPTTSERCVFHGEWHGRRDPGSGPPDETTACDFLVEDDSGTALVVVDRIAIEVPARRKQVVVQLVWSEPGRSGGSCQTEWSDPDGEPEELLAQAEEEHYTAVLRKGQEVDVCGVCHREPVTFGAARGYRDMPMGVVIRAPAGAELKVTSPESAKLICAPAKRDGEDEPASPVDAPAQADEGREHTKAWPLAAAVALLLLAAIALGWFTR